MPTVAGKSLSQAEAALRAAGLTVSSTTKPVGVNGTVVLNSVAGTVPPAGTSWPQNQAVTIEVVAGLALPNLVGQDINAIQQWASGNNIHAAADHRAEQPAAGHHRVPVGPAGNAGAARIHGQRHGLRGAAGGADPWRPDRPEASSRCSSS